MKKSNAWAIAWIAVSVFQFSAQVFAEEEVEVPVANVLAPARGYDDNDWIQVVATGELPGPCHTLGRTVVDRDPTRADRFKIRQMAMIRTTGNCGSGDLIEGPVPFMVEITLGKLSAGVYDVQYEISEGKKKSMDFKVVSAPTAEIDSFSYISVSNAVVPDFVEPGKKFSLRLTGQLPNRCTRLKEPVSVEKQGSVFVVLPILEEVAGRCDRAPENFDVSIELPAVKPGEYLVHVRSRNGKAINRVFVALRTPS